MGFRVDCHCHCLSNGFSSGLPLSLSIEWVFEWTAIVIVYRMGFRVDCHCHCLSMGFRVDCHCHCLSNGFSSGLPLSLSIDGFSRGLPLSLSIDELELEVSFQNENLSPSPWKPSEALRCLLAG